MGQLDSNVQSPTAVTGALNKSFANQSPPAFGFALTPPSM
jgi:hypothetical protein